MRHPGFVVASRRCLCLLTSLLLSAATVTAQEAPAHLAYVDGAVTIDREGESAAAATGQPLVPGDRLQTASGLAEIWFPDGSVLDLDAYTSVELLDHPL